MADLLPEHSRAPCVRDASPLEVYNIPLFEIPPMLDVRARSDYCRSHILCAVSVPSDDGPDMKQLLQRIVDHDEHWGWCLQHPFVIVHDGVNDERVKWLVNVLTQAVVARSELEGFDGADRAEQLLRRLSFQCKQILLVCHDKFAEAFGFCCMTGETFVGAEFYHEPGHELGPLPRCAMLQPRIFLAGRQVQLTKDIKCTKCSCPSAPANCSCMLRILGATHVVANADTWDIMDGTSGGNSQRPLQDRHSDVDGICYLKCDIPDKDDDPSLVQVLEGTAQFLKQCADQGGVAVVCVHGQSRSASVVCAAIMVARGVGVDGAWRIFQEASIQTDQNLIWWDPLQKLQRRLRKRAIEDVSPGPS